MCKPYTERIFSNSFETVQREDRLANSIKSKTLHALLWSFIESAGLQGIQYIVGIVLARLLLPEQYGLLGMLTIFIAMAQTFLKSGFGNALIQKKNADHVDLCSVFYFNIIIGLVAAIVLCLGAPLIAAFYRQPILTPLMRVLSLIIVIESFGVIQHTLILKKIDFKTLAKRSFLAIIPSGIIGVTLAATGFGVWSLVAQQLSNSFFMTVILWWLNKWRPTAVFSLKSLREMFRFGSRILLSGLLDTIFRNLYFLMIGKLFSAAQLGFYTRARQLAEGPAQQLTFMVGRVTFPVFSIIQDDRVQLKKALQKAMTMLILVNFPLMIGGMVLASPLILALLTEKWSPCIPYFRLLCLLGLFFPLPWINMNVLYAIGRSDLALRVNLVQKVLIILNIIITWRWGIQAIICGQILVSIISYAFNVYYNGALVGYLIREQFLDLCRYLAASILMGGIVFALGWIPYYNLWILLVVQIVAGSIIYVIICRFFQFPAFMEFWQMGLNRIRSQELTKA